MKQFFLPGIAAICIIMGASPALADKAYDRCINASSSNADWSVCGAEYLSRLDDQLNETWQRVFPALSDDGQALLRTEQRAWNAFKEESCLYYGSADYGREGQVLQLPACRGEIIEQRIQYLEELGAFGGTE